MPQDTLVCRFCLESKTTKKNPLLEPCECRGSIRYVHEVCLTRWRRQDPARNAELCRLCMTAYKIFGLQALEHIPDEVTIALWLLRFPIVLCFLVNSPFLLQLAFLKDAQVPVFFQAYQLLFQLVYLVLFCREWKVKHTQLYWHHWSHWSIRLHIVFHVAMNGLLFQGRYIAIIPLNTVLGMYWHRHRNILLRINSQ
jgi:hypothetical protein